MAVHLQWCRWTIHLEGDQDLQLDLDPDPHPAEAGQAVESSVTRAAARPLRPGLELPGLQPSLDEAGEQGWRKVGRKGIR